MRRFLRRRSDSTRSYTWRSARPMPGPLPPVDAGGASAGCLGARPSATTDFASPISTPARHLVAARLDGSGQAVWFTRRSPSPRGRFGWRVHPLVLFIIAKMNLESMQALPESHFCTFEPQRHHRNAFSGLSHFPQLLVVLGLPYSLGVLCTQNHFTMRSPFLARRGLRALLPGRDFPARTEVCYPDSAVRLAPFVRPKSPGQLR
jgi:hypothetical protein